jgi:hypothetical protein
VKSKRYRTIVIVLALVALAGWAWKLPVRPGAKVTVDLHGSADLLWRSAAVAGDSATSHPPQAIQPRLVEAYGKLPLSFEINRGQTDSRVKFLSRGSGYSLFLTGNEAVLSLSKPVQKANGKRQMAKGVAQRSSFNAAAFPALLPTTEQFKGSFAPRDEARIPDLGSRTPAVLRMKLVGANQQAKVSGLEELPGKSNYFIGNDPKKWRTNVPNYAKVKYANVYPGVDLVYYGNQGKLEHDFVVQPGADPRQIALQLAAPASSRHAAKMAALRIDKNGDLVVGTDDGEVVFHKALVYRL